MAQTELCSSYLSRPGLKKDFWCSAAYDASPNPSCATLPPFPDTGPHPGSQFLKKHRDEDGAQLGARKLPEAGGSPDSFCTPERVCSLNWTAMRGQLSNTIKKHSLWVRKILTSRHLATQLCNLNKMSDFSEPQFPHMRIIKTLGLQLLL